MNKTQLTKILLSLIALLLVSFKENSSSFIAEKSVIYDDNSFVIENIQLITNKTGLDIPYTSILLEKTAENGDRIFEFDFSHLSPQKLEQYNLITPEGIKTTICFDKEKKFKFLKWEISCCPGDNREVLILPTLENYIVMMHYYGMYGGEISLYLNNKEINKYDYEKDYLENNFFLYYETINK